MSKPTTKTKPPHRNVPFTPPTMDRDSQLLSEMARNYTKDRQVYDALMDVRELLQKRLGRGMS